MRKLFFLGGVGCIFIDYFVRSGLITAVGLAAILTSISNDGNHVNDWRTKYRPG